MNVEFELCSKVSSFHEVERRLISRCVAAVSQPQTSLRLTSPHPAGRMVVPLTVFVYFDGQDM